MLCRLARQPPHESLRRVWAMLWYPTVAKQSAGILLFRRRVRNQTDTLEIFLVHPGGPFWTHKEEGAWSIPKGEVEPGEDLFVRAVQELREETGVIVEGPFLPLGSARQGGGKVVHVWAAEADCDPSKIASNMFKLEWPPHSGKLREFPEVDRADWFDLDTAEQKINKGQRSLLRILREKLSEPG